MAEKYTLNWHTFSDHLKLMFKDLYQEGSHSDVTLVSDDQTQFKAHKIVLSACSPVFKKIIESNPSQHPLIYLRGIQSYEMESILQFMYLGEGRVHHGRMSEFLKVAQDLKVKGIIDSVELPGEEAEENLEEKAELAVEEVIPKDEMEEELVEETARQEVAPQAINLRQSKSKAQIDKKKFPCVMCKYQATTPGNLKTHVWSIHEGVKYPCDQCDYQATQKSVLKSHILGKHDLVL